MTKPKKTTTWRTCPNCGSKATKIYSLSTGLYSCQVCDHKYHFPSKGRYGSMHHASNHTP